MKQQAHEKAPHRRKLVGYTLAGNERIVRLSAFLML